MNSNQNSIQRESNKMIAIPWRFHFLIGSIGVIIIGIVSYGFYTGDRMATMYAPLTDAAMEIKLEATTAHLWFEEIVSGDRHETMEKVWKHLDKAAWYAQAMLQGGVNPEGTFIPLKDIEMRQGIKAVQKKLVKFRDITRQRLAEKETAGVGSDIDQHYDAIFMDFITQADHMETRLQQVMAQDLRSFRFIQVSMLVTCLLIFLFIGIAFHRFDRRRAKDFQIISETNEKLLNEILERKQIEKQRESLIDELETKNAELEQFTYTVSHDLKSPLITIKGFLGMLEKDALEGDTDRMKADMARISAAAEKMKHLLDELLELSRIGRMVNPPAEVPFGEMVREAMDVVGGRLAEGNVQVQIAPELPVIFGDPPRLQEVVENLIDNAVKYMGDKSDPLIEIGTRKDGQEAVFYVRDNGVGIDPRYHEKIFGLFDKLDPNTDGTGIGLAIVKRIVEVHSGQIWVESEGTGKGATFCFTIPDKGESKRKEG